MNLNVFEFFPWSWLLVSNHCDMRRCLIWFQFSLICWGLFYVLQCCLSLKIFHVHLKRMYILLLWNESFCIYHQLSPFYLGCHDADPSLWGLCVVDAMNKFTWTAEVLWRKRDGMATLWVREGPDPCLDRLLLLFHAHYIEDGPHLLCTGCL